MFHILAADDDKNMRRLLRAVPEAEHHTVSAACGGEDAHKVMEREHIDPVVPDIMMPRMDGHAFASLLRGARVETDSREGRTVFTVVLQKKAEVTP